MTAFIYHDTTHNVIIKVGAFKAFQYHTAASYISDIPSYPGHDVDMVIKTRFDVRNIVQR